MASPRQAYHGPTGPSGGRTAYHGPRGGGTRVAYHGQTAKKDGGHHGFLGGLENLGSDVVHVVPGIVHGAVQFAHDPVGAVKGIGKSYEQTYGPLLHGDISKFLHGVYQHPLGPLLDAATLLTLPLAEVGLPEAIAGSRAGMALERAGMVARTSKGARIGLVAGRGAREVALRNPAALVAEGHLPHLESDIAQVAQTLHKPLAAKGSRRLAQVAFDRVLKMTPASSPMVGEIARFNRELERVTRHGPLKLAQQVRDYRRAYHQLSKWETLAFHFRALAYHPHAYAEHLAREYAGKTMPKHVAKTIVMLGDPKLQKAFEQVSPRLQRALDEGRKLTGQLAEHHLEHARTHGGDVAEMQAGFMDRPYLHRRLLSGAAHDAETGAFEGGRTVEELQHDIGREGLDQPFYLPDLAPARRARDVFQKSGGGKGIPKPEEALRMNHGILFNTARLAMNPEVLDRAFMSHTRFVLHSAIHDALTQHAVRIPIGQHLPDGWEYVRSHTAERIGHTERIGGDVMKRVERFVPDSNEAYQNLITKNAAEAEGAGGYRLIVHSSTVKRLAGEFVRSESVFRTFFGKPMTVWRALVLGGRVGFFTNNVIGNNILYALKFAGVNGLSGYLRAVREIHGPAMVRRLLKMTPKDTPGLEQLYREYAPELAGGTFGRTQFEGIGTLGRVGKFTEGLGPITSAVAEDLPRKAGFIAAITPAVRAAMKADGKNFLQRLHPDRRTFEKYARQALDHDPHLAREAIDKVNDALGNYLNLSEFEKRTVRNLIPFYGWLRAISTITAKAARDTPGRLAVLTRLGLVGTELTQAQIGPLPDFLLNILPLGHPAHDQASVLATTGLNPFATIPQIGAGVKDVLTGKPGDIGRGMSELGMNPFITGIMQAASGKELFTGRDLPQGARGLPFSIAQQTFGGVPQMQLAQALRGHGRVSKLYGKQTGREAILQFLGLPVKQLDLARARGYAARQP